MGKGRTTEELAVWCLAAAVDFWTYCQLTAPDFYTDERPHLQRLCHTLQEFWLKSPALVLVVNTAPRHGKSRTLGKFVEWALGRDKSCKVMTGSYNEILSQGFAKSVRNNISEVKADYSRVVFSDIFPGVRIKKGEARADLWSLEGGYNNYLATSPGGTATGFGCDLLVLDDLIKNAEEANNERSKEKQWEWFTGTMFSRLEEGGKIICVMTRWATDDMAGRLLESFGDRAEHINMPAVQPDGSMLCPSILSAESCEERKQAMGLAVWSANYQQEPIDIKGRLYSNLKTYSGDLPQFKVIKGYVDTADTGADYLCAIVYGVTFQNEAYVLDVLYTKDAMEVTEPATADLLIRNKVNVCNIESNNGGRGFARNVVQLMAKAGSNRCAVHPFTQRKNKSARIFSNSNWVQEHIYYPAGWQNRWPDYYAAMAKYQKEGRNAHDDAPDATTGVAEDLCGGVAPVAMRINY